MTPFDYHPRTRIVFGPGKIYSLGDLAGELGARRVLLVSDRGIVAAGHAQRALDALAKAKIETHVFTDFSENPNSDDVEAGVKVAKRYDPELLVGLGGGSSMDCAKGINFVYTNGGRIHDYWGSNKALKPMLPMIAVPTTAGTGSESQSYALISDSKTHAKMACGDKKAACRIALLDPTLTVTQPKRVTALTGIDAIAHALETYVTKPRNPVSLAFSREAWRLLAENFAKVLEHPADLDARGAMQLGACFAGLAIENSMLGATHALANPLTAEYGIVHGQAIALMLPHVIRYNGEAFPDWYRELSEALNGINGFPSFHSGPDGLAGFIGELVEIAELPQKLSDCDVARDKLPALAADAAKQWTGTFNPRQVGAAELLSLYERAY
jgi:alcohol dehydrogenase